MTRKDIEEMFRIYDTELSEPLANALVWYVDKARADGKYEGVMYACDRIKADFGVKDEEDRTN